MAQVHNAGREQVGDRLSPASSLGNDYEAEEPDRGRAEVAQLIPAQGDLNWIDVAALVINKMIGTGIFVTPLNVLLATRNKTHAVVFWIIGFIYTLLSAGMYLEYSRELMYNGGELIYLDQTLSRPKSASWTVRLFGKPVKMSTHFRLLAYTLYAFYMIFIYNTTTNAMRFGEQVLLADQPTEVETQLNQPLLRFIAVVTISALCLLNLWSGSASLFVNKVFAVFKICLLCAVIIAGGCYVGNHKGISGSDWDPDVVPANGAWATALLLVLFSYFGWDNATQIAGEIPHYADLKKGFYVGVSLVGVLYVMFAIIVNYSFQWTDTAPQSFAALYFDNERAAAVLIAISALGNINSILYTCTRVNQSIAWASIFPFSNFWRRSTPRYTPATSISQETPAGGTLIHWIVTVFYIAVSTAYGSRGEDLEPAINFAGNLQIYGYAYTQAAVGLAFAFLYTPGSIKPGSIDREAPPAPKWFRPSFAPRLGPVLLAFVPVVLSIFIIAAAPIPVAGHVYPIVTLSVLAAGVLYWLASEMGFMKRLGVSANIEEHGVDTHLHPERNCQVCGRGDGHRHYVYGYLNYRSNRDRPETMNEELGDMRPPRH